MNTFKKALQTIMLVIIVCSGLSMLAPLIFTQHNNNGIVIIVASFAALLISTFTALLVDMVPEQKIPEPQSYPTYPIVASQVPTFLCLMHSDYAKHTAIASILAILISDIDKGYKPMECVFNSAILRLDYLDLDPYANREILQTVKAELKSKAYTHYGLYY